MVTMVLLWWLAVVPGTETRGQVPGSIAAGEQFRVNVNNRISDALDGMVSIKKVYWIRDNTSPAPKPDREKYGAVEKPKDMKPILEKAQPLLDGQKMLFSEDTEIMPGSDVKYYLDDSILAVAWKEVKNGCVLTFAEVKVIHPSQFRRFLSGDEFGSGKLYLTTEMSKSVNAVVAGSGDFYSYRHPGITVTDGIVRRNHRGIPDICYVKDNGDMMLVHNQNFGSTAAAQEYMNNNHVVFSLAFGPTLVKDGELVHIRGYAIGEVEQFYTRAAICQMDSLHYLYVTANTENGHFHLPDINEFGQWLYETGCRQAYALDGGQTATVTLNHKVVNHVNYGSQRMISDIIYFGTAVPEGED